jgi:hypothetical protein
LGQELGEGGADGFAGHPIEEAAAVQVDRAEDAAPPVLPWVITRWRMP